MATEATDEQGRTPLHLAALREPVERVRQLLDEGANVDAADRQGFTALHLAGLKNRDDVAEVLLEAGASVDPVDGWGDTPLFRAVFNAGGEPALVHRLVDAGADPDRQNEHGVSPRKLAETIGSVDTATYFCP